MTKGESKRVLKKERVPGKIIWIICCLRSFFFICKKEIMVCTCSDLSVFILMGVQKFYFVCLCCDIKLTMKLVACRFILDV